GLKILVSAVRFRPWPPNTHRWFGTSRLSQLRREASVLETRPFLLRGIPRVELRMPLRTILGIGLEKVIDQVAVLRFAFSQDDSDRSGHLQDREFDLSEGYSAAPAQVRKELAPGGSFLPQRVLIQMAVPDKNTRLGLYVVSQSAAAARDFLEKDRKQGYTDQDQRGVRKGYLGIEHDIACRRTKADQQHLLHRAQILLTAFSEEPHNDRQRGEKHEDPKCDLDKIQRRGVAKQESLPVERGNVGIHNGGRSLIVTLEMNSRSRGPRCAGGNAPKTESGDAIVPMQVAYRRLLINPSWSPPHIRALETFAAGSFDEREKQA
ncbi:MAG: hypothetical protein WBV61_00450, partial [Rhodanobacteraceae bacterium]